MIDVDSADLISLSALARRLPSTSGRRVNPSTVFRWAVTGLRGHKLEVVHIAGRMLTTWSAFQEFNAAANSGRAAEPTPARSPRQTRRIRDAQKILDAAGIGSGR